MTLLSAAILEVPGGRVLQYVDRFGILVVGLVECGCLAAASFRGRKTFSGVVPLLLLPRNLLACKPHLVVRPVTLRMRAR